MRGLSAAAYLAAALAAAVVVSVTLTAPAPGLRLEQVVPANVVTGGYHVHTTRSDGTGTIDEVAAAAARAGLQFVILTDHGDATRPPDPPSYRHGVLVIDAVEINSTAGHIVALGLTTGSSYALAGHPRDVIEDIHRLGGVAVVVHPDSPRRALRWRGQGVAFDGIEWLNVDSEWRDETSGRLIATAIRSIVRAPESIASLFARPVPSLARWDAAARRRPVFGLAALDAHANIPWRDGEEPRQYTALARPSYDAMFRTVSQSVVLPAPLAGEAAGDAASVLAAIVAGRSFSIIRALADPAALDFAATQGATTAQPGARLLAEAATTSFRATVAGARGARLTLLADGRALATGGGAVVYTGPTVPGVYRVEVVLPSAPVPWIVSNPIYVGPPLGPAGPPDPSTPPEERGETVRLSTADASWTIEREDGTSADVTEDGDALRLTFQLAGGTPHGQYAAFVSPIDLESGVDRVEFTGRADQPMRISLQLRLGGGRPRERWRRSVYLDTTPRRINISLQEFEAVDFVTSRRPIVARVQSLLFVVDTLNTKTGTRGVIWISDVAFGIKEP